MEEGFGGTVIKGYFLQCHRLMMFAVCCFADREKPDGVSVASFGHFGLPAGRTHSQSFVLRDFVRILREEKICNPCPYPIITPLEFKERSLTPRFAILHGANNRVRP
jgi:hypothetical protein